MKVVLITGDDKDVEGVEWTRVIERRFEEIEPFLVIGRYYGSGVDEAARNLLWKAGVYSPLSTFLPYPRSVNGLQILVNQLVASFTSKLMEGMEGHVEVFSNSDDVRENKWVNAILSRTDDDSFRVFGVKAFRTTSEGVTEELEWITTPSDGR